jgi:hypothetical protein
MIEDSLDGSVVVYQSPGRIDWEALQIQKIGHDELIRHFIFLQEFLWRKIDTVFKLKIA